MKSFYLLLFAVFLAVTYGYAQKAAPTSEAIELKEISYEFGSIPQGRPVTHNFQVINKSKAPLLIENVEASCGCTTPEWEQQPIAPGAVSTIRVGFNASAEGRFNKQITIYYGGNKVKTLTITGTVYPMPTTSAPLNASLSTLKQ
jgi:hypothetical protein